MLVVLKLEPSNKQAIEEMKEIEALHQTISKKMNERQSEIPIKISNKTSDVTKSPSIQAPVSTQKREIETPIKKSMVADNQQKTQINVQPKEQTRTEVSENRENKKSETDQSVDTIDRQRRPTDVVQIPINMNKKRKKIVIEEIESSGTQPTSTLVDSAQGSNHHLQEQSKPSKSDQHQHISAVVSANLPKEAPTTSYEFETFWNASKNNIKLFSSYLKVNQTKASAINSTVANWKSI